MLLLWCAWLLVPDPARRDLLGAPAGSDPAVAGSRVAVPLVAGAAEPVEAPVAAEPVGAGPSSGTDATGADVEDVGTTPVQAAPAPSEPSSGDPSAEPAPAVEVPQAGDGSFAVAPGSGEQVGTGELVRYSVEVEGGVPLDPVEVAAVVESVLGDPRSWTGQGRWALQRTDTGPDVRIRVASPDTTDALCAPLRTNGEVSCRNGPDVVLNALRWTRGAASWGADVDGYRQYLVNHELGHFLGNGHVRCPAAGEPAPVMLQQTIGLQGCAPNAWPYP